MKIERVAKVTKVDVSADEWQLYTRSMDCKQVARSLNRQFKYFCNVKGSTPEYVLEQMNKIRDQFSEFGAADTEPRYVLQDLINQVFGRYPNGAY